MFLSKRQLLSCCALFVIGSTIAVAQNATNAPGALTAYSAEASGPTPESAQPSLGKINHVVIIFQENRSTDNLFHDPVLINRGADIASTGLAGNTRVTLTPVPLVTDYDFNHSYISFLNTCDWNGSTCLMDGAINDACSPPSDCPPYAQYQYVQQSDVQPYFTMAETYAFGDRMFQTNQGPSFPAHQYIISGTSAVSTASPVYIAGIPFNNQEGSRSYAGCLAPATAVVYTIDTSMPFPNSTLGQIDGPECLEHPTLTDLLDQAGLTWKYYTVSAGSIWSAPDVIEHMCQPLSKRGKTVCNGPDWTGANPKVVIEGTQAQIIKDVQGGQLPTVTWVIPDGQASDHAGMNKGFGPSWVASIVNAVGESSFWSDTAIIVTWDDWGGWYDHVAPPIRNSGPYKNSYEYGFRVPIIVISPYSKPQYISHQQNDFGSILKFIEETFSLPQIDPEVGYADTYALGDLSDFFNFNQSPLHFTPIKTRYSKEYFLHNHAKPSPPDND
ncbi:MAG: alkaline phosphatase family protein [Terriglobales bacterium]